jgi:hypothetical protein
MTTLSCILRHVALGRLLVLCLLIAPPSACTTASDHDDSAPLTRTTERGPVELTVAIDSDRIEVGSPLTVELIATAHPDATVTTPLVDIADDAMLGGFHVLDAQQRPDYPGVDGQRVWSQTLILDTFTPGTLELPAFTVSFEDRRGDITVAGQLTTDTWPITITSVIGDAADTAALRDIRGHIGVPTNDWIIWASVGSGLALLLLGLLARRWSRLHAASEEPELSPHELARKQLDELEAEGLLEQHSYQTFYFRLSDILRHYIEGRFGMRAPKKTTPEFLTDLKTCAIFEHDQQTNLSHFMRCSDMVKFALHEPPVEEGREAMQLARVFVKDTEPIAEPLEAVN